jgi:hypothetical protein
VATPEPPESLRDSGKTLWIDVQSRYELEYHEELLLLEMCRTADQLDVLTALVERDGVQTKTGRIHPAAIEARQLRIAFARLAAALRLPAGDEADPAANRRPQRRVGARGCL